MSCALQTMQKSVKDQADKQEIREKRIFKSEQETEKLKRDTEKRAARLKAQEQSTVEEKVIVEELKVKLQAMESEVRDQQEAL